MPARKSHSPATQSRPLNQKEKKEVSSLKPPEKKAPPKRSSHSASRLASLAAPKQRVVETKSSNSSFNSAYKLDAAYIEKKELQ